MELFGYLFFFFLWFHGCAQFKFFYMFGIVLFFDTTPSFILYQNWVSILCFYPIKYIFVYFPKNVLLIKSYAKNLQHKNFNYILFSRATAFRKYILFFFFPCMRPFVMVCPSLQMLSVLAQRSPLLAKLRLLGAASARAAHSHESSGKCNVHCVCGVQCNDISDESRGSHGLKWNESQNEVRRNLTTQVNRYIRREGQWIKTRKRTPQEARINIYRTEDKVTWRWSHLK